MGRLSFLETTSEGAPLLCSWQELGLVHLPQDRCQVHREERLTQCWTALATLRLVGVLFPPPTHRACGHRECEAQGRHLAPTGRALTLRVPEPPRRPAVYTIPLHRGDRESNRETGD